MNDSENISGIEKRIQDLFEAFDDRFGVVTWRGKDGERYGTTYSELLIQYVDIARSDDERKLEKLEKIEHLLRYEPTIEKRMCEITVQGDRGNDYKIGI
jgi:hypothetical protein